MNLRHENKITAYATKSEWKEIVQACQSDIFKWNDYGEKIEIGDGYKKDSIEFNSYDEMTYNMRSLSNIYPHAIIHYYAEYTGEYWGKINEYAHNGLKITPAKFEATLEKVWKKAISGWLDFNNDKASGQNHTVSIQPDGTVVAEGENLFGECNVSEWQDIIQVSCGAWHTVGLKKDGTIVACGSNTNGQCDTSLSEKAIKISCGRYHTAVLLESGRVVVKGNIEQKVKLPEYRKPGTVLKSDFPLEYDVEINKYGADSNAINQRLEKTSVGDELTITEKRLNGYEMFEVFNKKGETLGFAGHDSWYVKPVMLAADKVRVTVSEVCPLSQKRKGSKYGTMSIRIDYIYEEPTIDNSKVIGGYSQVDFGKWDNIINIISLYDAVIGLKQNGEIVVNGFCPCTQEELKNKIVKVLTGGKLEVAPKTAVEIPKGMKIENGVLINYRGTLSDVIIPDGVVKIGRYAFKENKHVEEVTIPSSVIEIEKEAFDRCVKLQVVNLSEGLKTVGENAFSGVPAKKIILPNSVQEIQFHSLFTSVQFELGENVRRINAGLEGRKNKTEYDNAIYVGTKINPYMVLLKAKTTDIKTCEIHKDTKIIYDSAFRNCRNLTHIVIPDGVVSIENWAFAYCDILTELLIPEGVKYLGRGIVYKCFELKNISIPNSVVDVESYLFDADSKDQYGKYINDYNKKIEYNEFNNALYIGNDLNPYLILIKAKDKNIESCSIHQDARFVADRAFYECKNLIRVEIPDGVLDLGENTFDGCDKLSKINIPSKIKRLGSSLFYNCASLTDIIIPNRVDTLCSSAFRGCVALKNISIPDSVVEIEENVFSGCKNLEELFIPSTVVYLGGVLGKVAPECDKLMFYTDLKSRPRTWSEAWNCKDFNQYFGKSVPNVVWKSPRR